MGWTRSLFMIFVMSLTLLSCSDMRDGLLDYAVTSGSLKTAEALLAVNANPNSLNSDGMPLIGLALIDGNDDMADVLLKNGADINQAAPDSLPLLSYMIIHEHPSAARYLISHDIRLLDTCRDGLTALDYATRSEEPELAELIEEALVRINRQIILAVRESNLDRLRYLADRSPGPAGGYHFPEAILHDAVYYAPPEIVRFLVEWGVKLDAVRAGNKPITLAAYENRGETGVHTARILLEHGVDIDTKDQWGMTPLMHALRWGNSPDLALFLLEQGADPFIMADSSRASGHSNYRGYTTLMFALRNHGNSRLPLIERLIEKGVDVNDSQSNWDFPLLLASCGSSASLEKVQILLDHGADINQQSRGSGTTALQCAAYHRETDIFSYLMERGADIHIKDNDGYDLFAWIDLWTDPEEIEVRTEIFALIEAHTR